MVIMPEDVVDPRGVVDVDVVADDIAVDDIVVVFGDNHKQQLATTTTTMTRTRTS
jgi:hypothetical protein